MTPSPSCPYCGAPNGTFHALGCALTRGGVHTTIEPPSLLSELIGAAPKQVAPDTTKLSNPKDVVGVRKAPMSTVPANVLAELGVAMLEGSLKYGRHNYRAVGVRSSVYYDGTLRHLMSWWEGEDIDPDSNVSHITKAIASLTVLRDAQLNGKVVDDRPPKPAPFYPNLNARADDLVSRLGDKNPHHYTNKDAL